MALMHRSPVSVPHKPQHWWADAVGYQVYLRSFADSNDDGVGDLAGLTSRLDYLADLGVDFIWITPFYPSPGRDWGYDVAEYCDIDPVFGDLTAFDRLLAEAHQRDVRVVTDLVPNHTSSSHPWFRAALGEADAASQARCRDYYIWRDPAADGGPPNNWVSYFGGPAWTLDPASGQYYLHLFLPSQPDLNWRNPAVAQEWDEILAFWLNRGVDGFRVDVAGGLVKDADLRSNPQLRPVPAQASRWEEWDCFEHRHDVFQPESQRIFRRWRDLCDRHGAFLHGETYHLDPRGMDALLPPDGLHGGYWFAPMHIAWAPEAIRDALQAPSDSLASRLLWATSSHDMPRAPTRFAAPVGDPERDRVDGPERGGPDPARACWGAARTLAFNVLAAFMPGTFVLYQGEELGLADGEVAAADKLDPVGADGDVSAGRDGCRTPMPWGGGPHNGFSCTQPWLRCTARSPHETAAAQQGHERSWLRAYRELLEVQRQVRRSLGESDAAVRWTDDGAGPIISYSRGAIAVAANVGDAHHQVQAPAGATVIYDSAAASPHPWADCDRDTKRPVGNGPAPTAHGAPSSPSVSTQSSASHGSPSGSPSGSSNAESQRVHLLAPASAVVWQT